uniref:Major facilitator superfamily (MFS) profile domain-containing protein n=1 Tax=Lactuca sativa TaxID=4236 RepID=A0A9R1UKS2_LACSA|nr:hypothetical protein LSAT_V11C900501930 [Lactuca sativa]
MESECINLSLFTLTLDFKPVYRILINLSPQEVGHESGKLLNSRAIFYDEGIHVFCTNTRCVSSCQIFLVGTGLGWHYAIFGEAILMLPFAILGFVMKPLLMKGMSNAKIIPWFLNEEVSKKDSSYVSYISNQLSRFGQDMKALLSEKVYVVNILGYIVYNFVFGVYSYWGPKVGYNIYQVDNVDLLFGGIVTVGGIVGTIGGSVILDRINSTISNAFKVHIYIY